MLDLLIGVPLTIAAWNRGWRWWALLPLPAYLLSCFLAGLVLGASAGPEISQAQLKSSLVK